MCSSLTTYLPWAVLTDNTTLLRYIRGYSRSGWIRIVSHTPGFRSRARVQIRITISGPIWATAAIMYITYIMYKTPQVCLPSAFAMSRTYLPWRNTSGERYWLRWGTGRMGADSWIVTTLTISCACPLLGESVEARFDFGEVCAVNRSTGALLGISDQQVGGSAPFADFPSISGSKAQIPLW